MEGVFKELSRWSLQELLHTQHLHPHAFSLKKGYASYTPASKSLGLKEKTKPCKNNRVHIQTTLYIPQRGGREMTTSTTV